MLIEDDIAIVYKENRVYYCQKLKSDILRDELKEFLERNLKIENLSLVDKIQYTNKNLHTFFKPVKSKLFKYFLLYLLIFCIGLYFFEFEEKKNSFTLNRIQGETKNLKRDISFNYLSKDVVDFYTKTKEYSIEINKISFSNSIYLFVLESKDKKNIYELLKEFKNCSVEDMKYDKNLKRYVVNASFKISRK